MLSRFPKWRLLLPLFLCAVVTLAPTLAEARAGSSHSSSGSSFGSRGSRSFEQNGAQPLTRSMNPAPQATVPSTSPMGAPAAAAGGSFFQRHPFLTGLAGGFLGSMLFSGMGGFGHALGGILTFLIIGLLIFLAIRLLSGLFAGRGISSPGGGGGMPVPQSVGAAAAPSRNRFRGTDVAVGDADLTAFQQLHAAIQEAWSRGDLGRLRQLMTPEMVGYFSEELSRNASQGVQNIVTNVNLVKGDVSESWEEGDLQYATAYMRWSANDYNARIGRSPNDADYIVSGNPRVPTEAEEVWTFVRRRGANWLLSAIQQV
jgi:predicted lipid-binding transport protein (Tim44 family)